jgi:hypothetical protein
MGMKLELEKPVERRLAEMLDVYSQINALGLSNKMPGVRAFKEIAQAFVRDGVGGSGTIPLIEADRTIVYKMSMQNRVPSVVVLRARNSGGNEHKGKARPPP